MDYIEKIKKLLALSKSPCEAEAKAAMLKAQELMAKHKLSERDLGVSQKGNVVFEEVDVYYTKRRDSWIGVLSDVIARNYCCIALRHHRKKKQTQKVGFVGLKDDVEICKSVFLYAVDCVNSEIARLRKVGRGIPAATMRTVTEHYGHGFVQGCVEAFESQKEANEQEWGLVLVTPVEVTDALSNAGIREREFNISVNTQKNPELAELAYMEGYKNGKEFRPDRRLKD